MLSFVVAGIALFARRRDRAQFFLSFAVIWALLGIVGAYLGSSAGPCYTAAIGAASAPEYAGLLQRPEAIGAWRGTPLGAVDWQHMLWEAPARGHHAFGLGIPARLGRALCRVRVGQDGLCSVVGGLLQKNKYT